MFTGSIIVIARRVSACLSVCAGGAVTTGHLHATERLLHPHRLQVTGQRSAFSRRHRKLLRQRLHRFTTGIRTWPYP